MVEIGPEAMHLRGADAVNRGDAGYSWHIPTPRIVLDRAPIVVVARRASDMGVCTLVSGPLRDEARMFMSMPMSETWEDVEYQYRAISYGEPPELYDGWGTDVRASLALQGNVSILPPNTSGERFRHDTWELLLRIVKQRSHFGHAMLGDIIKYKAPEVLPSEMTADALSRMEWTSLPP
jgi:hypothetical protein